jgi:hypothetical protein
MSARSTAILIGAIVALWILLLAWAIAENRKVWKDVTGDIVLLKRLEHPGVKVTVRELGRAVKLAHPEVLAHYHELDVGRSLKNRYRPRYDDYEWLSRDKRS